MSQAEIIPLDTLTRAAESGNYRAQRELGKAYYEGQPALPRDYDKAYKWLLKAAAQQDPTAEDYLARLYEEGNGVDKDETKAFDWYQRAADQGERYSQYRVGNFYIEGRLIKADPAKGFAYLLHAACNDFPPAQLSVATCYAKGTFVQANPVLAYKWALLASTSFPPAQHTLPDFRKNLTPKQIDQGQVEAEDWFRRGKYGTPQDTLSIAFDNRGSRTKFYFAYANGNICIPVLIQDRVPVYMIVDTGAAKTIIDREAAAQLGITGNDYIALGAFGNNLALGTNVTGIQLKMEGMILSNARVTISPLSEAVSAFSEPHPFGDTPLGGLLGSDILSHFVLHIDYATSTIEFINPGDFQPDPTNDALPLTFHMQVPVIAATIKNGPQQSNPGNFIVDSGNGSALSLSRVFTSANSTLRLRVATFSGVFGLGGPNPAAVGKCTNLEIGKNTIPKPVFYLAQPREDLWSAGTIGNDVWKRFDVTIDYPGKTIYLKKNSDSALSQPFTCNLYGLLIKQLGEIPPTFIISKVWGGSAALMAGIREGDHVEKINGLDIAQIHSNQLQSFLNKEGVVELVISHDDHLRLVTLKSALLPEPN